MKTHPDGSKTPLPPIVVTVPDDVTIDQIKNVRHVNQILFRVEKYRQRKELIQCHKCQKFGHSKNYCEHPMACVRCAGPHLIQNCPRQGPPKCTNCDLEHVASFRGCEKRKTYAEAILKTKGTRTAPVGPHHSNPQNTVRPTPAASQSEGLPPPPPRPTPPIRPAWTSPAPTSTPTPAQAASPTPPTQRMSEIPPWLEQFTLTISQLMGQMTAMIQALTSHFNKP
nr:leucine-rich repeat extensin-like protein 3 [Halyomorpha halys]